MNFIVSNFKTIIIVAALAALIVLILKYQQKIKTFLLLEVKAELLKVSWSTRQELVGSTIVVIVITVILTFFIGIIDLALSQALSLLFR